jgi:hypothetical protein
VDANTRQVTIRVRQVNLEADLVAPWSSHPAVTFTHGGGRRHSPRNRCAGVHQYTMLMVGGRDLPVPDHSRQAVRALAGPTRLGVVPVTSQQFEEPGTLEQVANLASDGLASHLNQDASHCQGKGQR